MQQTDLLITGEVPLAGSLTKPRTKTPHPLVICIHGSGPLDRDENTKNQKLNIFNALAEHFAQNGIACFRYDKRGNGQSGGHYLSAGHTDLVADALAVARHFLDDPDISQIFLLGHSEGTVIAPQVAQSSAVDGLILLAPFITPLEKLLELQGAQMQRYIDEAKGGGAWFVRIYVRLMGGVSAINSKLISRVRGSQKPVIWSSFRRVGARWLREMLKLDPAAIYATVNCPTLIVVAGEDMQCPPEDGAEIAGIIGGNVTHVLIPGLSHLMRIEGQAHGFADYAAQLQRPMASEVQEAVAAWLAAQGEKYP